MRVKCQVCQVDGYLQVLGNYARVRHYKGINPITKKSEFFYHQQSRDYIENLNINGKGQCSSVQCKTENTIDLKPSSPNLNCVKEPRAGFEPATYSLQGCRSGQLSYRGTCLLHHRGRK